MKTLSVKQLRALGTCGLHIRRYRVERHLDRGVEDSEPLPISVWIATTSVDDLCWFLAHTDRPALVDFARWCAASFGTDDLAKVADVVPKDPWGEVTSATGARAAAWAARAAELDTALTYGNDERASVDRASRAAYFAFEVTEKKVGHMLLREELVRRILAAPALTGS